MQVVCPVLDAEYQVSLAFVFRVGKAQDVVNEFSFICMVLQLEIPMCAFGFHSDEFYNRCQQVVLKSHCVLRLLIGRDDLYLMPCITTTSLIPLHRRYHTLRKSVQLSVVFYDQTSVRPRPLDAPSYKIRECFP